MSAEMFTEMFTYSDVYIDVYSFVHRGVDQDTTSRCSKDANIFSQK